MNYGSAQEKDQQKQEEEPAVIPPGEDSPDDRLSALPQPEITAQDLSSLRLL